MSIMQSLYRDRFQRSMRGDFIDEMSGAHLDRGIALLERRKADAVAAEAYLALTAFWGTNEEKLRTAVDKLDTEDDRAQFNTTFNDNYLEDLENIAESRDTQASEHDYYRPDYEFNNFEDVVTNFLGKESAAIVMADMNDDDTALAVALVAENLTRMNISEEELARTVEKEVIDPETGAVDPERLTEFRARFEELQGRSFDEAVDEVYADYADNQYTAITWLQRMTSVNEEGKPTYTREEIAAAKVWWAIKGYGADTDTVKQAVVPPDAAAFSEEEQAQLQAIADPGLRQQRADEIRREKQDAYRAGLDAAYQELSGGETLEECVRYQFSDSYERTILHLMENGELEEIYEMREAMGTYMDGCDVDAVKRILSNKTKTEIDQFIEDFNKEFPDIDFLERLKVEVNGSDMSRRASSGALWSIVNPLAGMKAATSTPTDSQDWFDVQVLLEGDFSDVQPGTEQAVQALQ
ncbi:MAG: hypothetical protein KDD62_14190, partial [Bdellovibrionales bacterium]|nr:hypothetical protein [Bdellovibrionales bacterium]